VKMMLSAFLFAAIVFLVGETDGYDRGRNVRAEFECVDWGNEAFWRGVETGWQKCGCALADGGLQ
jgi:hypothetical protein